MARRAKVTCSIVTTSDGGGSDSGNFSLDDKGSGETFEDVRQREESSIATAGQLGAAFLDLDTPKVIEQFAMRSIDGAEVGIRYNGAPASVVGVGGAFATIVNGDAFTLDLDQGGVKTVTFQTGDTTLAKVIARINADVGAIVASDAAGQLKITGVKSGGEEAKARTWQYGSIVLAGSALAKLGLSAGTSYGSGRDDSTDGRILKDFPTSGAMKTTRIELSGSAKIKTHAAGRAQ